MARIPEEGRFIRQEWRDFIGNVVAHFNGRHASSSGGELRPPDTFSDNSGAYANQRNFFGRSHIHASVDVAERDGVDVSVFFFPSALSDSGAAALDDALHEAFPTRKVWLREANGGSAVVVTIAETGVSLTEELAGSTSDALARLIGVARGVIEAEPEA